MEKQESQLLFNFHVHIYILIELSFKCILHLQSIFVESKEIPTGLILYCYSCSLHSRPVQTTVNSTVISMCVYIYIYNSMCIMRQLIEL